MQTLPIGPQTGVELLSIAESIGDWIFVGLLVFAAILIVFAAFQFANGGGDPAQVAAARKNIIFAVIGIIIALLSKGVVTVVRSVLGL